MTIIFNELRCPTLEEIEIYLFDLASNKFGFYEEIKAMECYQ